MYYSCTFSYLMPVISAHFIGKTNAAEYFNTLHTWAEYYLQTLQSQLSQRSTLNDLGMVHIVGLTEKQFSQLNISFPLFIQSKYSENKQETECTRPSVLFRQMVTPYNIYVLFIKHGVLHESGCKIIKHIVPSPETLSKIEDILLFNK